MKKEPVKDKKMDEGEEGHGDPSNEATSSIAEDCENLDKDINVDKDFLQSSQTNEDPIVKNHDVEDKKPPTPPPPLPTVQDFSDVSLPNNEVVESRVSDIKNEVGIKKSGIRVELLKKKSTNLNKIEEDGGNGDSGCGRGDGKGNRGHDILFVGDLQWWTTDAELEEELCKYGRVKDLIFFEEDDNGKFKGYCQVQFYDIIAASACEEGMNGHVFNGKPCIVSFATPIGVKKMGQEQTCRNRRRPQTDPASRGGRGASEATARIPGGGIVRTGIDGDNNNRGNLGRGPVNPVRNIEMGIGVAPRMMHHQLMENQGFNPEFGGFMGNMGGFRGYPGSLAPSFSWRLLSCPGIGFRGVAPRVNPPFVGRGMPMSGMGMWQNPNIGGWGPSVRRFKDVPRENDVGHDHEWSGDRDCDMHREDRDMFAAPDHQAPHNDEWERGRSSRNPIESRLSTHKDEHHFRKDYDIRKRRRRHDSE